MHLEKILGSKSKIRILKSLVMGNELQLSEIKRRTNLSLSTIHESLKDLVELKVLIVRSIGKTRLYRINQGNYFARMAVKLIIQGEKFHGMVLKEYMSKIKKNGIENITVFGSYARGEKMPKDIDILIIAKNKPKTKRNAIEVEGFLLEKYDMHISTIVLEGKEFAEKFKASDKFILNVIAEGKKLYGRDLEMLAHG